MALPQLDKNRHFGTLCPPSDAHFWQDGHYFGVDGRYLRSDAGANGAVKAALSASEVKKAPVTDEGDKGEDEIDLAGWARGEKKYGFFSVKAAVKALYPDADVGTAKSTKTALVDAGVVSHDDVKW